MIVIELHSSFNCKRFSFGEAVLNLLVTVETNGQTFWNWQLMKQPCFFLIGKTDAPASTVKQLFLAVFCIFMPDAPFAYNPFAFA